MLSPRAFITALVALGSVSSVVADISLAGCFDNFGDLQNFGPNTYQTQGLCLGQCLKAGLAVFAVYKGSTCFCGDQVPPKGEVDMGQCNRQCQGYSDICGGDNAWLVGYTGATPSNVPKPTQTSKSQSTSGSTVVQTTVVVQGNQTVTATAKNTGVKSGGGGSKAGVAAGVVVGVIAIIAIGVGAFLLIRRNKRLRAEEEYRAALAAKEFTASIKKPAPDSRLDPVMLQHRRLSDGSIADEQDYSRRILKVTNPDGA